MEIVPSKCVTRSASYPRKGTVNCWPKAVAISQAEGLSAVTLRRVATDLGVTPGLVSHYFSSAEQLIAAAFRTAAVADLDGGAHPGRRRVDPDGKIDALMDYVLDDVSEEASALWLDAWSLGRRNPTLAAEATALTEDWLEFIGDSSARAPGPGTSACPTWQ